MRCKREINCRGKGAEEGTGRLISGQSDLPHAPRPFLAVCLCLHYDVMSRARVFDIMISIISSDDFPKLK